MAPFADVFGRLHPLILHLPIGLIVGIVVVEAVAIFRSRNSRRRARAAPPLLLWLTAAAALVAVATGLKLAAEDGYGGQTLDLHQWVGIAFAIAAIVTATLRTLAGPRPRPAHLRLYRGALLVTFGLVGAAGHLGATMTHGENFLFEPFDSYARLADAASQTDAPGTTAQAVASPPVALAPLSEAGFSTIEPILAERCYSCHSGSRTKGGLALDSFDRILAGGNSGPTVAVGSPGDSELLHRILLPVEEEGHMPPAGKRQLTPADIAAIDAWVKGTPASPETIADAQAPADQEQAPTTAEEPMAEAAPPDAAAIAAIEATLSHISPIKADSNLLWIDLSSAFPRLEEQQILDLLRPVAPNVVELTLSRCSVTDEVASVAAQMPRLQRLNLHGTDVTDATVLALAHHPALRELILTQTKVSDAAIQSLLEMPALEQVYLWESQVSPDGLAMLQEGQEGLLADAGAGRESDVLVVEPEPKLIDAAVAGAAAPTGATVAGGPSLEPVNTVCPVSDKPVDPRFLVVHEGRVIGFCCSNCPSQFWADPATYVAKLK